ncbi:MAG: carbohydrate ABC transporter substrate-binding protein [Ilumatobacter sp.]|nr:carbohydrate ABC transporter substrate-binding protein [Ilumatobacter sp.]
MTAQTPGSPSPSEFGISLFGRRRFIAGAAGATGAAAVLAACGSDDDGGASSPATDAAGDDPPATEPSGDVGSTTFGSNYSDEKPRAGMAAAIEATGVATEINTIDHNSYQENFNTYVQQPDDVLAWFAGYRMRAFAAKGVVGDISDVWADLDQSEGFKNASTGRDGKQYFVPFYFYAWGVHYRKSLFEEKGYEIPTDWAGFIALCEQMEADGITPISAANDGGWPQMGMFDMINMRTNGYDFHVSLMGGSESWTDDRVKQVFTNWMDLLPFYQPDANGREWQAAANSLGAKETGMYLIGNFLTSNFDAETQQDIIDDIDFFPFPEIDPAYGQDAIEAPIDGFMMAASPANEDGAKALLRGLGSADAINAYIAVDPSVVAAANGADTASYNALQQKASDLVGSAKFISQFLDRDTDPAFASEVVGKAIADFLSDPGSIDGLLATVEEQKATFTFE